MKGRRRAVNMVEAAVDLAGGVTVVAKELGVSRQAVYKWIAAGDMTKARFKHTAELSRLSKVPIQRLMGLD
jgi:DNA-binding phage protein